MFRSLLRMLAGGIRWFFFTLTIVLAIEELVRVPRWVIGHWGPLHALIDGAVLYKLGEAAVLLPFLVFVHFNGRWNAERAARFARRTRWVMRTGGVLCLAASFDLFGRVPWAFWPVVVAVLSAILPSLMERTAGGRALKTGYVLASGIVVAAILVNAEGIFLGSGAIAPLPTSIPAAAATSAERWQQDLDYLVENLELLHANVYHTTSREDFAREAARLRDAIPNLSEAEIRVGLTCLVARVGDAHTDVVGWNSPAARRYPVRFYQLSDGLFVIAAPQAHAEILEGRLVRLNRTDADSALARARAMAPAETQGHVALLTARYLSNVDVLDVLGIAAPDEGLLVTVVSADGDTASARLYAGERASLVAPDPAPPFRQTGKQYWSRFDDNDSTAYLKYNAFLDPVGFRTFGSGFWKVVEKRALDYVIVDFRENSGGNSATFTPFFKQILDHQGINRPGHLYVLVDRSTFSSAVLYTGFLRRDTHALVAGEEMGGAVNAYGDVRRFHLPNSGIEITYSSRHFDPWPTDRPPWRLDIPVEVSSQQYFAGEDPVLDEVMARIRADQQ